MDALTASLSLLRLEGIGPASYWQLVERFGSALAALRQPPENLTRKLPDRARAQLAEFQRLEMDSELGQWALAERQRCAEECIYLLHWEHDSYPALLKEITRPPPVLYLCGNPDTLSLPQIAVVGARRASRAGLDNAQAFAAELASSGFAITSGLALGVDAAAHKGALQGAGKTVAVLGTGVNRVYPRRNAVLAEQILAADGAIVSEMPLGTAPEAGNFPRRNRIISGLSVGTLLVEAAVRSGSLITARLALEQNREVFAIPGSIHNPLARGCHHMIKHGAHLVETSADIVEHLGGLLSGMAQQPGLFEEKAATAGVSLPGEQGAIIRALGGDPRSIEQLARDTGGDTGELMACLLHLELEGLVEQLPGGYQLTGSGARTLSALAES
ncbi:DNA-processing protein DprA [Microbulbifer hydrolyticus]|uniref:DNA processing protein n=1 Tax=Microbulbifer hydrolyticus TaxID=48074 RepID=A0A6P1TG53_9GAMM|nr:DNA-processing protein DprA [Microbulbifer hydrolyticus]MBB5211782.1 DNA processing protein [Microbulbifer hydrolyticus]QHQ40623.1 DNA-protecting protein DprA [Microbulbifer hydrolyticus]